MLVRKLWRRLVCKYKGHEWYHYTEHGTYYKLYPTLAIRHRVCQHCGMAQTAIPTGTLEDIAQGLPMGCLWVSRTQAERAMSDPTYYNAIGDEQ